jgi:hypothetical protein
MYVRPYAFVEIIEKRAVYLYKKDNPYRNGYVTRKEICGGKVGDATYRAVTDGFYYRTVMCF